MNLTKTLIPLLNNCYIDCSYSNITNGNTNLVNIEIPSGNGETVRSPFTIRTKDGYSLKYNENTGNVVYRLSRKWSDYEYTEPQVIAHYKENFTDYTFNLKTLSTYENTNPVIDFITPTYRIRGGDGIYKNIPLFEYSDIAQQKENIFIIDTGFKNNIGVATYIISYFGKNANKCKLDLGVEVDTTYLEPGEEPTYTFKTKNGRYFRISSSNSIALFGADEYGQGGKSITGIVSISVNAEKVGEVIEEDNTDGLFTTYVVKQKDLKKIADTGSIYSEIIINTFSYPLKFVEEDFNDMQKCSNLAKIMNMDVDEFKLEYSYLLKV